jgi:hypothetical protein
VRGASPWVWPIGLLPALPYAFVSMAVWRFPGCPPESLAYPGHPAPSLPLAGSVEIVGLMWLWFFVWLAASVGVHVLLRGRESRTANVFSFIVPAAVTLTTPFAVLFGLAIATLC